MLQAGIQLFHECIHNWPNRRLLLEQGQRGSCCEPDKSSGSGMQFDEVHKKRQTAMIAPHGRGKVIVVLRAGEPQLHTGGVPGERTGKAVARRGGTGQAASQR